MSNNNSPPVTQMICDLIVNMDFFKKIKHHKSEKSTNVNSSDLTQTDTKHKKSKKKSKNNDSIANVMVQSSDNHSVPVLENKSTIETTRDFKPNNRHLVCDDAFANRLVLKKYLLLYECHVDEAENGLDAITKVTENGLYNIIWMDIKMPKMDGFVCTDKLRNELHYPGPVIGLTGYVDEITVKKCYDLGMTHVIAKPFDKVVIQNYCEKYQTSEVS